ncbi:hypothetical protein [Kalamiella sp. sgz302252]|uniref:hypothetical protein n=1 Tax=Pantoea sp. sgz302252 TaxID=3341827 RepID=UPI0036D23A40
MNENMMEKISENLRIKFDIVSSTLSAREELVGKIKKIHTCDNKNILWSKTNAFSIIPFYNELMGYKSGKMQFKNPRAKKNTYCYFASDENIDKIVSYNSKGEVGDESFIVRENNEVMEIRREANGEFIALSQVFLDELKRPLTAYFVNDEGDITGYHYFYDGAFIKKILTVSNNSPLKFVILSCDYNTDGVIDRIYFINKGREVVIYPR